MNELLADARSPRGLSRDTLRRLNDVLKNAKVKLTHLGHWRKMKNLGASYPASHTDIHLLTHSLTHSYYHTVSRCLTLYPGPASNSPESAFDVNGALLPTSLVSTHITHLCQGSV